MLTDKQIEMLRDIDNSVAFAEGGDDVDRLVIDGFVERDGDLYELTAKGEKALLDNGLGLNA
ncbi:MAG: hypothetical protein ABWY18_17325 [Tardiphaga sp.]|jgi:hypothetical protein